MKRTMKPETRFSLIMFITLMGLLLVGMLIFLWNNDALPPKPQPPSSGQLAPLPTFVPLVPARREPFSQPGVPFGPYRQPTPLPITIPKWT